MSGIGNIPKNFKYTAKRFIKQPLNIRRVVEDGLKMAGDIFTPDNSAMEALMKEQMKPTPMADEEELKKARRRSGNVSTGRASTILTSGNTTKLGG